MEKRFFEDLFDVELQIVSLHRPGPFLEQNNRQLPDCRHTYEDQFFKQMTYFADSGGRFAYGHPLKAAAVAAGQNVHLLIHPIWWVTEDANPSDKLRTWQRQIYKFINDETVRNCKTFDGEQAQ